MSPWYVSRVYVKCVTQCRQLANVCQVLGPYEYGMWIHWTRTGWELSLEFETPMAATSNTSHCVKFSRVGRLKSANGSSPASQFKALAQLMYYREPRRLLSYISGK